VLELETTKKYRKDRRLMKKRGLNLSELDDVIKKLQNQEVLDDKYRDHKLSNAVV